MKLLSVRQIRLLTLVVLGAVATATFASPQTKAPAATATKASAAPAANPTFQKTIGNPSAPITMEVFGDFQCPACRGFFEGTCLLYTSDAADE